MIDHRHLFHGAAAMTMQDFNQPQPYVDVELAWGGAVTRSSARMEHDPESGVLQVYSTITGEPVDRFAPGQNSWRVARGYSAKGTLLAVARCER